MADPPDSILDIASILEKNEVNALGGVGKPVLYKILVRDAHVVELDVRFAPGASEDELAEPDLLRGVDDSAHHLNSLLHSVEVSP